MKKKILLIVISIGLLIFVVNGFRAVYSKETLEVPKESPAIKEVNPENKISIAHTEIFGELERPPVVFDHFKHVKALKDKGCQICHELNKEKAVLNFIFPKNIKEKDKDSIMNGYHDECIGCHKKLYKEDKKTGPVTCADCHKKEFKLVKLTYPVVEFDYKLHDTHDKKLQEKGIKENCNLCHHIYNEELVYEKGKEWSCYNCHDIGKKRSPLLAIPNKITAQKGLNIQKASHKRCLNCHLYYMGKAEKSGPVNCTECHTGKYRTIAELENIPRPDAGQKDKPLIEIDNSKMKGVLFDHKTHEKYSRTCKECHHQTLYPCKECHTLTGSTNGAGINTANAYHDVFSKYSCAECHNKKKTEANCAGCHSQLSMMDIKAKTPNKEICAKCHTGKKEISEPAPLTADKLDPEVVKKDVEIKILEKEFNPSKFPHRKIIDKFVKISNESKLGRYFHTDLQVLCAGCHHQSSSEAEAKKDTPPNCKNCHSISFDPRYPNRPRLLAAYHRQCIKCHQEMNLEKPKKCTECHEEKKNRPKQILTGSSSR